MSFDPVVVWKRITSAPTLDWLVSWQDFPTQLKAHLHAPLSSVSRGVCGWVDFCEIDYMLCDIEIIRNVSVEIFSNNNMLYLTSYVAVDICLTWSVRMLGWLWFGAIEWLHYVIIRRYFRRYFLIILKQAVTIKLSKDGIFLHYKWYILI